MGLLKGNLIDTIVKIVLTLAVAGILIGLLPPSPFPAIIESIAALPMISYINWFFPVGQAIGILSSWAAAIVVFYGISWILRQLGIIGS